MWPAPRHQRAPGLCVPAGEPGHVGVDCGAAATCSPVCGWRGPSCDVATSTSGQKKGVPVNVEGPSRDCAPQTHTPCGGTPALTEGAPASAGCAAEQRSRQQCAGVPASRARRAAGTSPVSRHAVGGLSGAAPGPVPCPPVSLPVGGHLGSASGAAVGARGRFPRGRGFGPLGVGPGRGPLGARHRP